MDCSYKLMATAPEFRFAELRFSVPAQSFAGQLSFGIVPARLDGGIFFSIRCSLAECGKFILKRVCDLCITVSQSIRRAVRRVRRAVRYFRQRQAAKKIVTYLSCCVFRC